MGDIVDDYITGNYTFEQLGEKYDTEIDLIYDTIINSDLPPDYSSQYEGQFAHLKQSRHFETRCFEALSRLLSLGIGPESPLFSQNRFGPGFGMEPIPKYIPSC